MGDGRRRRRGGRGRDVWCSLSNLTLYVVREREGGGWGDISPLSCFAVTKRKGFYFIDGKQGQSR